MTVLMVSFRPGDSEKPRRGMQLLGREIDDRQDGGPHHDNASEACGRSRDGGERYRYEQHQDSRRHGASWASGGSFRKSICHSALDACVYPSIDTAEEALYEVSLFCMGKFLAGV